MKIGNSRLVAYLTVIVTILFVLGCEKMPEWLRFGKRRAEEKYEPKPTKVVKGEVLAKINDRVITLEEFNEKRNALLGEMKEFYSGAEGARMFLEFLINRELLISEALDRRLDQDETVMKIMEAFEEQILFERIQRMEMEKASVTSPEVEDYYKSYREVFKEPEERSVRAVVLATESDAKLALIELLKGADFITMARERSIAPSAKDGGDLGFIVRKTPFTPAGKKTMFPRFAEAAFSLSIGDISSIFKGPDGYYIVKLEEVKEAKQRSLEDVYSEIEEGLLTMKRERAIEALMTRLKREAEKRGKIEVNDWLLR